MPGDITQNNALLNGFTDGNTTFHVKETITERDYLQTNCWLRLELDPDMVGIVDDGWYLSFDFDNIILDNLPFKWVLPYYDSDGKDIHGFLIFVQILHDGHCITRLHAPNAVTAYESACDLTYARSTDDLMRAPCTSMPLEAPPYAFVATNTVSPHGTNLVVRFVDRQLYTPNQNIKYAIDEAMYWVFVDILPAYSHRLGTDSISMTVAPLANNPNNSDDFRTFIPLYSDVTCSQLDGWLIYGSEANCENLDQMEYSTECFYYLTRLTTSHTSPVNIVITDLTASRMNTSYLLNTLMRNPDFYKTVNGSNNSSALIYTLTDNYSAFRELMWRNDAVQEIMNYTALENTSYNKVPYLLLNTPHFRSRMTTEETAMFITHSYPSARFTFSGYADRVTPRALDTEQLVKFIHTSGFPTEDVLLCFRQSDNTELTLAIYRHLSPQFVYLQELECRKDALQWMIRYVQNDPREDSILPYLIGIWSDIMPHDPVDPVVSVEPEVTADP